ncbi:MAG: histidine kinase, partial [Flavisolibacter sp.]|nr:histidine kinase [Flavisolibacter sp.]
MERFAYIASHDLQEPLRKILTFASLLEKESAPVLSKKSKMFVEKIVQSSTRMQKLIDDILQFSSLKAMEGDFMPVDLSAVLD